MPLFAQSFGLEMGFSWRMSTLQSPFLKKLMYGFHEEGLSAKTKLIGNIRKVINPTVVVLKHLLMLILFAKLMQD